ncbi:MAG: restriction endonuclease subunit S [Myxococcales bacterium]|nr:restriction endonuclease subunit S [Myxococcales bacterium]
MARLESGHTPSRRKSEYWGGDVPWIGIKDAGAHHGRDIEDTTQHTNALGIANSAARVLPAGTVCLSRTASIGYITRMSVPMATSQDFVNWVCGEELDSRYLMYVLLAEVESLFRFAHGSTHQTIYYPEVKAFHALLPPLDEQRRIAAVLGALDDKIELNRKMNQTLEAMAQAIFKSWFIDFDGVPDADMVDSELGRIPKGWEVKPVADFICFNPATRLARGALAPFVDMKALPTNGCSVSEVTSRVVKGGGAKFMQGDTLFARITPCLENGKTALVDFLSSGQVAFGSTEFIVMRPTGPFGREWVYCLARSTDFRHHAISNMTGSSGRQRVPVDCFRNYFMAEPPAREAQAFKGATSALFDRIKGNSDESRTLAALRDTLLPKLISGEIRVPEAEAAVEAAT